MNDKSSNGKRRLVGVVIVDTLGSHVAREDATISGETGNGDADVVIDLEDLLLVRRKLGVGLVYACQDHVCLGS